MTEILVLPQIDTTHEGPAAPGPDGEEQLVHLQQGSMDGACGPYGVCMALLTLGLVARDDITGWGWYDKRTHEGRLLRAMNERHETLFREGTNLDDLVELLQGVFSSSKLALTPCEDTGVACRKFVEHAVREGSPVLLNIDWPQGGHWVLLVGLEYVVKDETRTLCRFLLLDPSSAAPTVCAWNGVVDAQATGGPYPYTWWTDGNGGDTKVAFAGALAFSRP